MTLPRRRLWLLAAAALVLVALAVLSRWLSQPEQVASLVLGQIGRSQGLEITAKGAIDYRLRGAPVLVVRDVMVREPGSATVMLRADRVHVSLPWSTVRSRGRELAIKRIELDSPQLDLPALQRWLATRPPREERIPTLSDGLRINNGTLINDGWRIDGIDARLPLVHPDKPVQARLRGRYTDAPLAIPFDLAVSLSRPDRVADFAANGDVSVEHTDWRIPATVTVSGPLRVGSDDIRLTPARIGIAARYDAGETRVPITLGLHGPLLFDEATWSLAPVQLVLRGEGVVPALRAAGAAALGQRLALRLEGAIARWPETWPALPPPMGQSSSPLPFAWHYTGKPDLSDASTLALHRDSTRFDARFRLPAVADWINAPASSTPLPPLTGTLSTPRIDIAGARLEGVEIHIEDDAPTAAPTP